ncbi:MAG: hypothetical protein NVS2B17_15550 [Candidatus Velthaea sp.]
MVTVTDKKGNVANVTILVRQPYAYFADQGLGVVDVVDLARNTVIKQIAVGQIPVGIALTPAGDIAYVANYGDDSVSIIDTGSNTVIATIPEAGGPDAVTSSRDGRIMYVGNYKAGTVGVIDTLSRTVVATIANMGARPVRMVLAPDGSRLYVMPNDSTLRVVNTTTNTALAPITLGNYYFLGNDVVLNPTASRAYVAGSFTAGTAVVDTSLQSLIATIPDAPPLPGTSFAATTGALAISPDGRKLYAAAYDSNEVSVYDLLGGTAPTVQAVAGPPTYGSTLGHMHLSTDGSRLYIIKSGTLYTLDASTFAVLSSLQISSTLSDFALSP